MSHLFSHKSASLSRQRGFTLIEMMIVIGIIVILLSIAMFPYEYYMSRARLQQSIDTVGQKWVLAHKDVRNGKLYDDNTSAGYVWIMRRGTMTIEQYLLSGSIDATWEQRSMQIQSVRLESGVRVVGFSGVSLGTDDFLGYYIEPPSAIGVFFTGAYMPFSSTGVFLSLGYNDSDIELSRSRQILLRPYLQ